MATTNNNSYGRICLHFLNLDRLQFGRFVGWSLSNIIFTHSWNYVIACRVDTWATGFERMSNEQKSYSIYIHLHVWCVIESMYIGKHKCMGKWVMLFFPTKDIPNLSRIISSLWIVRCTQIMGAIILKSGAGVLRKYYRDACRDKLCRDK